MTLISYDGQGIFHDTALFNEAPLPAQSQWQKQEQSLARAALKFLTRYEAEAAP